MSARLLRADWVVPVTGAPVRDGAVLIDDAGRVEAIAPAGAIGSVDCPVEDLPGTALLPGLVNAHTHLELTGMAGQADATDFVEWIGTIRRLKEARSPDEYRAAARAGIRACWAAGVTTVADTGDSGAVIEALADLGGSGIAYQEVFGPDPAQVEASTAWLRARLEALRPFATGRVRLGVSPHAPYSVSGPLYRKVAHDARAEGLPIAVHIAESAEESALLADGTGGFAALWTRRGIPLPSGGHSPVAWLDRHGVLGPDTLCIHVVRAGTRDLDRLAEAGCGVAHCPLSNRRHGHGTAPLAGLRAAGVRVGVGTDSEASVAPLDLLAEARAARALAGLDAREALALCTHRAAGAIGLGQEVGTLAAGRWADLTAIALPVGSAGVDVEEAVLASGPAEVRATWVGGRLVHQRAGRPAHPGPDPLAAGPRGL